MTDVPLLITFIAAATVLTITPGVDTAIVLRAAMTDGRSQAWMASLGIALGCLMWGASVSFGLGVLLQASEIAYTALKLAGAAYLVWQGLRLLLKPREALSTEAAVAPPQHGRSAFWRGFLTNLLNPKVGVFYITFLPQFVPAGASVAAYTFFLACLHVVLTLVWFIALIAATMPLSPLLRRPSAVRILDRLTGAIFITFGARLATSSPH